MHLGNEALLGELRALWAQPLILNRPGKSRESIGDDIQSGLAELESYGQMILANPDFTSRVKTGAPLNSADPATYYGGGVEGYVDYPSM